MNDPGQARYVAKSSVRVIGHNLVNLSSNSNREYTNAYPCTFIIKNGILETENANNPHGDGLIDPQRFVPFPKNPTLVKFFIQLGRVEELGSGVLNINRYVKAYSGKGQPELIEGPVFKVRIPLPEYGKTGNSTGQEEGDRVLGTILTLLNEGLKNSGDGVNDTVNKTDDTVNDTDGISREVKIETAKVIGLISTEEGLNMKSIVAKSK